MAEQPAISLRTLPRDESEKQSLAYLIARINAQKGLFRNITEDSVRQEIRETTDGVQLSDEAEDDESSSENESVDGKSRREEVLAARDEVIKFALYATRSIPFLLLVDHPQRGPYPEFACSRLCVFGAIQVCSETS